MYRAVIDSIRDSLLVCVILGGACLSATAAGTNPPGRSVQATSQAGVAGVRAVGRREDGIEDVVNEVLVQSANHMAKGQACLATGDMDCARTEFDTAIDVVITSGLDVRGNDLLAARWRSMIDAINESQLSALAGSRAGSWKAQEFDERPEPEAEVPKEAPLTANDADGGPLTPEEFQKRFAGLESLFQKKYGRQIVITGADHEEHRRLYGAGSAVDIRVRDLTRDEIRFIIDTGRQLGLRVKDFSSWEKVEAHNARVRSLGLGSDTLATAVHLHIDRNPAAARTGRYEAAPAVLSDRDR
ncbi:MAG TPA: hypothetical protein VJX67_23030 [Blastocatellia bacterium]|nr:hypothetical protein [Blastocatellia bacterium]